MAKNIADWFETANKDNSGNWLYFDDIIEVLPTKSIFSIWGNYRRTGGLPEPGGWLDQPLDIINQMQVLQTAYETFSSKADKNFNWKDFTPTQNELIRQQETWR